VEELIFRRPILALGDGTVLNRDSVDTHRADPARFADALSCVDLAAGPSAGREEAAMIFITAKFLIKAEDADDWPRIVSQAVDQDDWSELGELAVPGR
jgi:hypothetical protein